jgi:hypothetical protein
LHLELLRQVLLEPWMVPDPGDVDAVGWVPDKDFADEVHALSGQMQVAGEAVLHSHDPLKATATQSQTVHDTQQSDNKTQHWVAQ